MKMILSALLRRCGMAREHAREADHQALRHPVFYRALMRQDFSGADVRVVNG
jgi:hypothetical protein